MSKQVSITGQDVQEMVSHHLGTPVNGYLGSPFGQDIKSMLHTPQNSPAGNEFIAKMREDLPVLALIPDNQINIYFKDGKPDEKSLLVEVSGQVFVVGGE